MKGDIPLLFFVFLLLSGYAGLSQQPLSLHFRHLDHTEGLSDPNVRYLHSDHLGFLWIGTYNGLNRFDGTTCVNFHNNEQDSLNLAGSMVTQILETKQGDFWIGTEKGLSFYDYKKGSFRYFSFPEINNGNYYYASPFYIDSNSRLWSNAAGGIYVIDSTLRTITFQTSGKTSFWAEKGFPKWLITPSRVSGVDVHFLNGYKVEKSKTFFAWKNPGCFVSDVYVASDTLVWLASDRGLISLNPYSGASKMYEADTKINCLVPYKDWLFLGTEDAGLWIFDTKQKKIIATFKHQFNNPASLSGNQIERIRIDAKGNLFVNVSGKGLDYTDINQAIFPHILDKESSGKLNFDNNITAVYQAPSGDVWCGTNLSGIVVYDKNLTKIKANYLKNKGVNKIIPVDEKGLFIELKNLTYLYYPYSSGKFQPVSLDTTFAYGISLAVKDPLDGKTIVCSSGGIGYLEGNPKLYVRLLEKLNHSLEWSHVSHVFFLNNDEILVQTYYTNLYLLRRENNDFKIVREVARTPFNINKSLRVGNTVFLASTSGLFTYDISSGKLSEKPLLTAYCTDAVSDKLGSLWINTNSGLYRYTIAKNVFRSYRQSDGLQSSVFNAGTLALLQDGTIITGGSNGLNHFRPVDLPETDSYTKAFITQLSVNNQVYTAANPITLKSLHLDYKSNTLTFLITPLDFRNSGLRKLSYQMIGYDAEPTETRDVSEIRYVRIPPGNYQLRINVEGGAEATVLDIYITPPFWKTWWFFIFSGLTIIGLTFFLTYSFGKWVKNSQLEKLRIMLNSQEEERKRIAIDLHDDLGGRLSSLKLYMQATSKGISDEYRATFRDTTRLLDDAISELRNILFNLSPKTLDENGLEAAIKDLSGNIERITKLSIETNIDNSLITGKAVQYAIYRICQELINNTLKYSEATKVYISLVNREDELVFLYEDNGKGFLMEEVQAGYGLTNIKTHAQAIYSEITIDTSPGKGVAVTLTIPKHAINFEPKLSAGRFLI
jgi:ligand-binding sensor domain-containing protein/signal transduction histidine kinase